MIDDEPWFVGKDVAVALGYSNHRDALYKHVDSEDKNTVAIRDGIQGNPNMAIINESGVYSLIFGSKLEGAKRFKRWVTSKVLPALRKTGHYEMPGYDKKPSSVGEVVNMVKLARRSMKERGCSEADVAKMMDEMYRQFGIRLPEGFLDAPGYNTQGAMPKPFVDIFSELFHKN